MSLCHLAGDADDSRTRRQGSVGGQLVQQHNHAIILWQRCNQVQIWQYTRRNDREVGSDRTFWQFSRTAYSILGAHNYKLHHEKNWMMFTKHTCNISLMTGPHWSPCEKYNMNLHIMHLPWQLYLKYLGGKINNLKLKVVLPPWPTVTSSTTESLLVFWHYCQWVCRHVHRCLNSLFLSSFCCSSTGKACWLLYCPTSPFLHDLPFFLPSYLA